jgi:hypothetical protein
MRLRGLKIQETINASFYVVQGFSPGKYYRAWNSPG